MLPNSLSVSKILICDDHPVSQLGIQYAMIDLFPKNIFQFTKTALGNEAVDLLTTKPFDLLTLDLRLPDISGIDVVKKLREFSIETKIMILTSEESLPALFQLFQYKVNAILHKSYTLPLLKSAFKHVDQDVSGRMFLDPHLESRLKAMTKTQALTAREYEVLELLIKGLTNKEVASLLECSPETVKSHRARIMEKTDSHSRADISEWYYRGIEK